jgi:hypothetical protein
MFKKQRVVRRSTLTLTRFLLLLVRTHGPCERKRRVLTGHAEGALLGLCGR